MLFPSKIMEMPACLPRLCTETPGRVCARWKVLCDWDMLVGLLALVLSSPLTSLEAQVVKNLRAIQKSQVRSLGREDPLEKGMATHSSILAWEIPWTEEPGGLQSMGSQRVRHDWVTNTLWLAGEYATGHTHPLTIRYVDYQIGVIVCFCMKFAKHFWMEGGYSHPPKINRRILHPHTHSHTHRPRYA